MSVSAVSPMSVSLAVNRKLEFSMLLCPNMLCLRCLRCLDPLLVAGSDEDLAQAAAEKQESGKRRILSQSQIDFLPVQPVQE